MWGSVVAHHSSRDDVVPHAGVDSSMAPSEVLHRTFRIAFPEDVPKAFFGFFPIKSFELANPGDILESIVRKVYVPDPGDPVFSPSDMDVGKRSAVCAAVEHDGQGARGVQA